MYIRPFFSVSFSLVILLTTLSFAADDGGGAAHSKRAAKKLVLKVEPWGPSQAEVDEARRIARNSDVLRREMGSSKFREVGFEYLYGESGPKSAPSNPPTGFRVIYYNYSSDKTLFVEGTFAAKNRLLARWADIVPGVGGEEIRAAYGIVEQDSAVVQRKQSGTIELYEPMPPTTVVNGERLVNIGILNPKTGENEIVGVSFKNNTVVRYSDNAPPTSAATPQSCGVPNSNQGSSGQGLAGQSTLTVNDAQGNVLWEMLIIRPSSSSGASFERSGLEIRDVRYKGKSVLKRGHVPILNVKYVNSCGPFRDWQYSEGFFVAPEAGSQNPAPGIRILAPGQIATTVIETRNDTGNFQGVAIYTQDVGNGPEVILVTELNAGWYRYIMEWRFATDGTIRPRFGFGSIVDSCVCIQRTHHVYWRLDFDVVSPTNRIYLMDRGRRFQQLMTSEMKLYKRPQTSRSLVIQNSNGNEAYQLVPDKNDGAVVDALGNVFDAFGSGDFWMLRFKGTSASPDELADPWSTAYPAANIDAWLNDESLVDQDIVVWYAGHQVRVDDASRADETNVISGAHIVGPVLRPIRW